MTQKEQIEAYERIGNRFEGKLKAAFIEAVREAGDRINVSELEEAIANKFPQGIIDASHVSDIEQLLFGFGVAGVAFSQEMTNAYMFGATTAQSLFPERIAVNISFDITNPETVAYLNTYRPQQIRLITEESRNAIAQIISNGYQQGRTPVQMAQSIRDVIGLTPAQAKAVENFRRQLEGRSNLGLTPVGRRRIDAIAQRQAIRQLRTGFMTQRQIDAAVEKYRQSMLNRRALNIARTESFQAVSEGREALWRQAQEQGLLPADVKRKWITAGDERVRPEHRAVPGMNKDGVGLYEPFKTPLGPKMRPPLGVNCRCSTVLINL